MRTFILIPTICFLVPVIGLSQSETLKDPSSKISVNWYLSINTAFFEDINVNASLDDAGLLTINNIAIGAQVGTDFNFGKSIINIESGLFSNTPNKESNQSASMRYLSASLSYNYKLIEWEKFSDIYLGLGYNFSAYNADIYSKSDNANLNDLSPDDLNGALSLHSFNQGAGIFISFVSQNNNNWLSGTSLKIAYLFDFSKRDWESESVNLTNSISEDFSRINFSIIIPILREQ